MTGVLYHIVQIGGIKGENLILSVSSTTVICFTCLGESKISKNKVFQEVD